MLTRRRTQKSATSREKHKSSMKTSNQNESKYTFYTSFDWKSNELAMIITGLVLLTRMGF